MERMKKVAQEKKKWKDKAKQGGAGNTENSGGALPAVQSVPVSKGGQVGALYGLQSMSSSSGIGSSSLQSSIATWPAPSFSGGSLATAAFYKPQAVPPPLPRGNFRPQEQPSVFKSQTPSKVCNSNFLNLIISFYLLR